MDPLKEAFQKVKQDIDTLGFEIDSIKLGLKEVNWKLSILSEDLKDLKLIFKTPSPPLTNPTHIIANKTDAFKIPAHPAVFKPLNDQILGISTGNKGVPTDKQTDKQTDDPTQKYLFNPSIMLKTTPKNIDNPIQSAVEILDSLDSIKREIRLKFKRLTDQEILVFSTLYQLDEEKGFADYKSLSQKLNLTESSIRDYISRLINKGIPVDKKKINNKTIHLFISRDLKKLAPLSTILQLRDL